MIGYFLLEQRVTEPDGGVAEPCKGSGSILEGIRIRGLDPKPELQSQSCTRDTEPDIKDPEPEIRDPEPNLRNQESEIWDPEPDIRNPEPSRARDPDQ